MYPLPQNSQSLTNLPVLLGCTESASGYCLPLKKNDININQLVSSGSQFTCTPDKNVTLSFEIEPCNSYTVYCIATTENNMPSQIKGINRLYSCDNVIQKQGIGMGETILYLLIISVIIVGGIVAYKKMFMSSGEVESFIRQVNDEEAEPFNQV